MPPTVSSVQGLRSIVTVEPVFFCYMLATWLSFPSQYGLFYDKVCLAKYGAELCKNLSSKSNKTMQPEEDFVQSHTSSWMLYSTVCLTLPSLISATFIGSWSDKISHKVPIILPSVGAILGCIIFIICATYEDIPIGVILISPLLSGIFGGFVTSILTVFSYITALTGTNTRTWRVAILESMSFLGGTAGLFLSGVLLDNYGFPTVFGIIIALHIIVIIYTLVWVLDIRTEAATLRGNRNLCSYLFGFEHVVDYVKCVIKTREDRNRMNMWLVIVSLLIGFLCFSGIKDISYLFLRHDPLKWSRTMYGYYQGYQMGLTFLVLFIATPILKTYFKLHDTTLILMGISSTILSQILFSLSSHSKWMIYLVPILGMFHGFQPASSRALLSTFVDKGEQGKLFAFVASTESITTLLASIIFNSLYPVTLTFFIGFCFVLSAALQVICLVLIGLVRYDLTSEPDQKYQSFVNPEEEGSHPASAIVVDVQHESTELQENDSHLSVQNAEAENFKI